MTKQALLAILIIVAFLALAYGLVVPLSEGLDEIEHFGVTRYVAQAGQPFLDAAAYAAKSGLDNETWWQVTQSTVAQPFSIMEHLITPDGLAQKVSDGLGLSPLLLNVGDVVMQRYHFAAPSAKQIVLRTGAYWLDTLQRRPVVGMDVDWLLLRLEVKS